MFVTTKACLGAIFLAAVFLATGWAGLSWTTPVSAAQSRPCAEHDAALKALMEKFAEAPAAAGLSADGALLEVLTKPDGGTWTILMTEAGGQSCIIAAGEGWTWRKRPLLGRLVKDLVDDAQSITPGSVTPGPRPARPNHQI